MAARPYLVKRADTIADAGTMRLSEFELAPGEAIPWHFHSAVTDWFVCTAGRLRIETRAPTATHELAPGERATVPPMTAHRVSNAGAGDAAFTLVQGVGAYDFNPVGAAPGGR